MKMTNISKWSIVTYSLLQKKKWYNIHSKFIALYYRYE